MQARVAGKGAVGQQLPFELERGLFGREQNKRQTFRSFLQSVTNLGQAAECLAATGRAEEESRLHKTFLTRATNGDKGTKKFYFRDWTAFVPPLVPMLTA